MLHRTVRAWPGMARAVLPKMFSTKLSPEEMDEAIDEMNREMEELFGIPPGSNAPEGPLGSNHGMGSARPGGGSPHANAPSAPARPQPTPAIAFEPHEGVKAARAALLSQIDTCTAELSAGQSTGGAAISSLERSTSLAACIGECARAVAALEGMGGGGGRSGP
jgi:hypothetical protein